MEMLTRPQADRIATAIRVVRPEWDTAEIMATLSHDDIRNRRGYADTFHAILAIALDDATNHPNRLLAAGPWWSIRGTAGVNTSSLLPVIDFGTDCVECLKPADHPWHINSGGIHDHPFVHPRNHQPAPRPEGLKA
jgi:hypothetical protein